MEVTVHIWPFSIIRGGSIVADFLAKKTASINADRLVAAVRSESQANSLSKLGVRILQLDLLDEEAVVRSVLHYNSMRTSPITFLPRRIPDSFLVSIVIHTASSIKSSLALHLITALSKQGELRGEKTYFIHVSTCIWSARLPCEWRRKWPGGRPRDWVHFSKIPVGQPDRLRTRTRCSIQRRSWPTPPLSER